MKTPSIIYCLTLCFIYLASITFSYASNSIEAAKKPTANPKRLSGGQATVFSTGRNAFSLPSKNMPLMQKLDFNVGNSFFRNPWVIAPASTDARDGLGPLFNTNGCQNCHIKDGRGHAPDSPEDNAVSLLVRLSIPDHDSSNSNEKTLPEPIYGGQLQDFAIPGVKPEGRIRIDYQPLTKQFADGETVILREPKLSITELAYGPLHPKAQLSARIASPMIGLGLLEAISEDDILSIADPEDKNNDGISGKANQVWSEETQSLALGRFGWKAGQPSVRQQNAAAFNGDLGITSTLFVKDHCTDKQVECLQAPHGGEPELSNKLLDLVTFYSKNLAVPARRNIGNEIIMLGEQLFSDIGCADCHQPQWKTSADYAMPWLANQTIYPYTDLLLHDMGEGLADNRPEALASGREWRTPPLWGIGLTAAVGEKTHFLHDGRARNLTEAILWHGGEAAQSQKAFMNMEKTKRSALISFLNSL